MNPNLININITDKKKLRNIVISKKKNLILNATRNSGNVNFRFFFTVKCKLSTVLHCVNIR